MEGEIAFVTKSDFSSFKLNALQLLAMVVEQEYPLGADGDHHRVLQRVVDHLGHLIEHVALRPRTSPEEEYFRTKP